MKVDQYVHNMEEAFRKFQVLQIQKIMTNPKWSRVERTPQEWDEEWRYFLKDYLVHISDKVPGRHKSGGTKGIDDE